MVEKVFAHRKANIQKQLQHPNPEARDKTRWWWYGCAVEEAEICRELDFMKDALMGGVELQILYPVQPDQKEKNVKNQYYFSPEYLNAIRYAQQEAKKRGLQFDYTLGSSWPYGGPFVTEEMSAPNVIPYSIDVKGPCTFSYDFTTRIYGECVGCIMGKMEQCEMVPESIVDLTEQIVDKYLFRWEWGKELKDIKIPSGEYKIVLFVINDKKQMVLKPLPGGEGMIIDHNRKDAARLFFENAGDPVAEYLGKGCVANYFCDSIEVFGQNWTKIVYDEFSKRRGYSLRPYIYALWGNVRGMTEQIRYDFQKTLSELTVENFFEELTAWCHEKGAKSRIQAHGTWGDVLKAYGAADIPEGETFSEFDKYEVNTIHRRLASSAGHIYGKQIISNESYTWLRFPRFIVTPEQIKAATDAIFLDGINQIVNHGYSYSPPDAGKLGLPFYASSQINHTNTWWPQFKHISLYINRVCDFLQRGKPKVKLAIYLPQHDIWAENPLSDIHMCMKLEERIGTEVVDAIQKAGYWFDYVNDEALTHFDTYEYEALLIPVCQRIPVETAENIEKYAQQGIPVLCMKKAPDCACGLIRYEENTRKIRAIFTTLTKENKCIISTGEIESTLRLLDKIMIPDVKMEYSKETIGYVHRADQEEDIYFIANISKEYHTERITFSRQTNAFAVFDPMKGTEKEICAKISTESDTIVEVTLEPFQSLLFFFSPYINEANLLEQSKCTEELINISKNWELEVAEKEFVSTYEELVSWEQEKDLKYYSGKGIYRKQIVLEQAVWEHIQEAKHVYLCFSHIGETAQIYINQSHAGDLFMHPYRLDIRPFLRRGENVLEVEVSNLLINCAIDPAYEEPLMEGMLRDEWPYHTAKLNREIEERVYNWRERELIKEPLASGLWGNISLEIET